MIEPPVLSMNKELRKGWVHNQQISNSSKYQTDNRIVQVGMKRVFALFKIRVIVRLDCYYYDARNYPYKAINVRLESVFNQQTSNECSLNRKTKIGNESEDDDWPL